MSRLVAIFGQLLLILAGYAAACVAASLFLVALVLSPLGWTAEELPYALTGSLLVVVPFVALFVAYFAFVPASVAVLVLEATSLRDWLWNALAGGGVGAAVYIAIWSVPADRTELPVGDTALMLAFAATGIVGGLAYWLVAGRAAGEWKS